MTMIIENTLAETIENAVSCADENGTPVTVVINDMNHTVMTVFNAERNDYTFYFDDEAFDSVESMTAYIGETIPYIHEPAVKMTIPNKVLSNLKKLATKYTFNEDLSKYAEVFTVNGRQHIAKIMNVRRMGRTLYNLYVDYHIVDTISMLDCYAD